MSGFEEYLEALGVALARHLPEWLRKLRVAEIRTHLEMDQADREASGLDSASAAQLAKRALGSPMVVARQMIRQSQGFDSISAGRLTWACGVAMTLANAIPLWFLLQGHVQSLPELAFRWLPFLSLVYFGFLVVRTQRWLIKPMAVWSVVAVLTATLVEVASVSPANHSTPASVQRIDKAIRSVNEEEKLVRAWHDGHPPLDRAPTGSKQIMWRTYITMIPIGISSSQTTYTLSPAAHAAKAKDLWNRYGKFYEADLRTRLTNLHDLLSIETGPSPSAHRYWPTVAFLVIAEAAVTIAIFAIVNWGLLCLSTLFIKRKNRRDPLLA